MPERSRQKKIGWWGGVHALAVLLFAAGPASAQSAWQPATVFVQAGKEGGTDSATLGLTWDTPVRWSLGGGVLALFAEASVSEWSYPTLGDRATLTQVAAVPVFRFRGAGGASPWFAEAAVGLSLTNHLYDDGRKHFSTAFNFADHLGVGYDFGSHRQHELAARVEHFSNGSIKEPNPGKTFLQVRYAYRF